MHSRFYEYNRDYNDLLEWWKWWREAKHLFSNIENPPSPELLPVTGIMIENNYKKICCGFLYKTDSICCNIDWFISNPYTYKEDRKDCIDYLISSLIGRAYIDGYKIIYCFTSDKNIQRKMNKDFSFYNLAGQKMIYRI